MDNPAWSERGWYTVIVNTCLQDKVVVNPMMDTTTQSVLKWIKDCRGHQLWQLCCDLIGSNDHLKVERYQQHPDILSILMDELEYMSLLIKEFSGRPAQL